MIRTIIRIDQEKCNGCGACVSACHEQAIVLKNGKACLLRDDYCDGLGNCLPACPAGAISFEEREAAPYDAEAVKKHVSGKAEAAGTGCPGSRLREFRTRESFAGAGKESHSQLRQWPVQIKLVPVNASFFADADVLVAATCSAFARGSFHEDFMAGRITLVGCPKLDGIDYSEKLAEIFRVNTVRRITVVRMEVPCCFGLEKAVDRAVRRSGKTLPVSVVTLRTDGGIQH